MTPASEEEMIKVLNVTPERFKEYLDTGVFAPLISTKRGRPSKNKKGAIYDADTVVKEVNDFESGRFTPVQNESISSELAKDKSDRSNDCVGLEVEKQNGKTGRVIRLDGIEGKKAKEKEAENFDYEGVVGDISTLKLLRKAIIKVTPMPDVPLRVKRDLQKTYEMMCKERERRDMRKKKITIEKYQSDTQKVFNVAMSAWSGENGIEAAKKIVQQIEIATGKPLQREISNIVQIVHRSIVDVQNRLVQPQVLKVLEKL